MTAPTLTERQVLDVLTEVIDPEIGMNIVDLGLIYDVRVQGSAVRVQMTLTTPGCPMHESIASGVRMALLNRDEVQEAEVEIIWDPPWNPAMMTPEGRAQLERR
jgi:metal-sulfur cluster biosynthetic enzyme